MRKTCGKKMPLANNGNERGFCTLQIGHGRCGNGTCFGCGVKLRKVNSRPSVFKKGFGQCRNCWRKYVFDRRRLNGCHVMNRQTPGRAHIFPCGCSGTLPCSKGEANQFASATKRTWTCRVTKILLGSKDTSKRYGYKPIDQKTPHKVIRQLMAAKKCGRCRQPLAWNFTSGKQFGQTPNLHHDHETGKALHFVHSGAKCNPKDLQTRICELETEVKQLKDRLLKAA